MEREEWSSSFSFLTAPNRLWCISSEEALSSSCALQTSQQDTLIAKEKSVLLMAICYRHDCREDRNRDKSAVNLINAIDGYHSSGINR